MPKLKLTAIDEGYNVVVSSRLLGADDPQIVHDAILQLFPDFTCGLPENPKFPSDQDDILASDNISMQTFLEAIHKQFILDTALDYMSANLDENGTVFHICGKQQWLGKSLSHCQGNPLGGLITIEIEGDNLADWLEAATWHSGRENIPRKIGDEFSMLSDGDASTWH